MVAPLSAVVVDAGLPLFANYLLPVAGLVAIFTTMLVGMTSASHVIAALAERNLFPNAFAATSDRADTPYVALCAVTVAAAAVVPTHGRPDQRTTARSPGRKCQYAQFDT